MRKMGEITMLTKMTNFITFIFLSVFLMGCNNGNEEELSRYIDDVNNRAAKAIKPIPAIKPYLRYVYPEHEKDPFDISILAPVVSAVKDIQHVEQGIKLDAARVPEFLEGFTLDSLHMVGTIHRQGELWALVKVPSGGIQRLKKGNYIGKNFGLIKEITTSRINIKEIVPNGFGGYKPRENAISLVDAD